MADDATSATGNAGAPSRRAGSMKTASTMKAIPIPTSARNPRQRATATMTIANTTASMASGQARS